MRHLARVVVVVVLAMGVVPIAASAQACVDGPCTDYCKSAHDDHLAPLISDFSPSPATVPTPGTNFHAKAFEGLTGCNSISEATLAIDEGSDAPIHLSMTPADGTFGPPDQDESLDAVVGITDLGIGVHDVKIVVADDAETPNFGTLQRRVFTFGPFLTVDCEGAPPGLCG